MSLSVIYLIHIVRVYHMPQERRNRLTMIIWWSLLLNLLALQIENSMLLALNITVAYRNELWSYALNSTACFFFTNAIML